MGNKAAVNGTAVVALVVAANLLHTASHVGHGVVSLQPWQWVYVVAVLYLAPFVAAGLLWTRHRLAGAWLLLASMSGSFAFDFAYHFLIPGPDNAFTLHPGPWLVPFWATSVLLVVSNGLGAAVGGWAVAGHPRGPARSRSAEKQSQITALHKEARR